MFKITAVTLSVHVPCGELEWWFLSQNVESVPAVAVDSSQSVDGRNRIRITNVIISPFHHRSSSIFPVFLVILIALLIVRFYQLIRATD